MYVCEGYRMRGEVIFKYLCFQRPCPPKYFIILREAHQTFRTFRHLILFTKTCQSVLACTRVAMTA